MSELRPRRAWWILILIGLLSLAAAAFLAFSPGFRLAPPTPFGETMQVELSAGTHAIYVTPSDRWGDIDCTGTIADGGDVQLRPDMTMQGLLVPEAWDAQGSFVTATAGNTALTCDGPVEGGRFTVGPIQSIFDIAGAAAVGVLAVVLLILGVILRLVRRRPRA
ncbi:hypothetical protein [Microbacterium saperdae]|uniref:Uncharacterized protein n=1 Tax=Microbacterium saperdae TaxID=69368 RepID=A0A543BBE3_9MICO|nr:hypothetical protein [Microbacterium saperdae]TQL82157.1 hypothetical protein FB560_3640 [Microbacterium saperdae]